MERLRDEFMRALEVQRELLVSNGIARHEKALLRIEAVETAQNVFKEDLIRVPTQLDRETTRLDQLFNEKLRALTAHVDDVQRLCQGEQYAANGAMLAAFQSTEKISHNHRVAFEQQIAKSENSFTKDLDGLRMLLNANQQTITSDVRNLTGRLDRGEGLTHGQRQELGDRRETNTLHTQIVAQIIGFVIIVLMIGGLWVSTHSGSQGANADAQNAVLNQRLDALSARLNGLTGPFQSYTQPQQR